MTIRIRASNEDTQPDSGLAAAAAAKRLASKIINEWNRGGKPDTQKVLNSHPELSKFRSIVLTLAYEEYCCRVEAGETIDPDSYANKFDSYQSEVLRHLHVHSYLMEHCPELRSGRGAWPVPGDRFLGFDLLQELGRGAIARVFLAREASLGDRLVVVKVSHHGEAEAQILGRLSHRNVVPVLSVQNDESTALTAVCMPYLGHATMADILMDLFSGASRPKQATAFKEAATRLSRDTISKEVSLDKAVTLKGDYISGSLAIIRDLAAALEFTHRQGVLHLDLKPSNILMTPRGVPMLLDFNLSADSRIEMDRVGGTLPYMSPEQVRRIVDPKSRNSAYVDARSDIYSLGIVLCEMLIGKHPFGDTVNQNTGADAAARLLDRQQAGFEPRDLLSKGVERNIAKLIRRCTAFQPEDRPQSAAELLRDLDKELGYRRRFVRWAKSNPLRALKQGGAIVFALAMAAFFFWTRPTADRAAWDRGWEEYAASDYTAAAQHFQRLLDDFDQSQFVTSGDAWVALGKARQKSQDWTLAARCFRKAFEITRDGQWAAAAGFCFLRYGATTPAIVSCQMAEEAGYCTPALYHNWGLALDGAGAPQSEVLRRYDLALSLRPDFWPTYRARGRFNFNRSSSENGQASIDVIADMQRAIAITEGLGKKNAQLYFEMAVMQSVASSAVATNDAVERSLVAALRAGIDPGRVKVAVTIKQRLGETIVERLIERESNGGGTAPLVAALDPTVEPPL